MSQTLIIAQSRVSMEEPHNCTDAKDVLNILSAFFDPLVAYDAQMKYVPALATSWQVSDDARCWTFTLRPDVTFHNGQPVDAEAVVYSLTRMARPDMGVTLGAPGVYNQYMAGMTLNIIDRHKVEIKLAEPMADLLHVDSPPVGETKLTDWASLHRDRLGYSYASELARRMDRTKAYDDQ